MTIVEKVRNQIQAYCKEKNIELTLEEYEEMFINMYGRYVDALLTNPPKSKRKNGIN